MNVVKIEKALLKRLYEEPELEGKILLWREIGRRAKVVAKALPAPSMDTDESGHSQGR